MKDTAFLAEVLSPGALTTVQDAGRRGVAALGWSECGAADKHAMRLANLLAGNGVKSNAAVLESTLSGPTLRFSGSAVLAVAGAAFHPTVNGVPLPLHTPFAVQAGDVLSLGIAKSGLRGYLAVYGGWDVPLIMGSRSTDLKCGVGGYQGRALKKGDFLSSTAMPDDVALCRKRLDEVCWNPAWNALRTPLFRGRVQGTRRWPVLRAVPGPQEEAFTPDGYETFFHARCTLTADCNRMACKLSGARVETVQGSDILSDGIVEGSVQIASDGSPIVMLADHQTTGGYAKIATVIPTDVAVLAQLRPGENVGFCPVTPAEAVQIVRAENERFLWLEKQLFRQKQEGKV